VKAKQEAKRKADSEKAKQKARQQADEEKTKQEPKEEADKEKPSFQTEFLWHIGIHYLTPYRPTFRATTVSGDVDASAVPVIGTNEYFTIWPAMQKLSLDVAWFAKFFIIRESQKPMGSFQPANATMTPLLPGVGKQFWPPPKRTRKSASVAVAADDLAVDPDVSEEHDAEEDQQAEEEALEQLLEDSLGALVQAYEEKGDGGQDGVAAADSKTDAADDAAEVKGPDPGPEPNSSDDGSDSSSSSSSTSSSDEDKGLRGTADIALRVTGGVIRYYENKKAFTATCGNADHNRCVVTRTAQAAANASSTNINVSAKGRPLGYLVAWLSMSDGCVDKAQHWSVDNAPDHAHRTASRTELETNPSAAAAALLAKERAQRAGEGPEPNGLP